MRKLLSITYWWKWRSLQRSCLYSFRLLFWIYWRSKFWIKIWVDILTKMLSEQLTPSPSHWCQCTGVFRTSRSLKLWKSRQKWKILVAQTTSLIILFFQDSTLFLWREQKNWLWIVCLSDQNNANLLIHYSLQLGWCFREGEISGYWKLWHFQNCVNLFFSKVNSNRFTRELMYTTDLQR